MTVSSRTERRLRIGAVSYLNTKPLIYRFSEFVPDAELVLDVPSRLADRLAAKDLDIALIPSVEAFQNPDYHIVSDACIACRGPVLSVKLLSHVPISEIGTLALDAGSRTSIALVQILLRQLHGLSPELVDLPLGIHSTESASQHEAVLMIGDRAIHASSKLFAHQWDLGEQWVEWTGRPFVFAMWTARPGVDANQVATSLRQVRDIGVTKFAEIATAAAPEVRLDEQTCLSYLRDNLHFTMGTDEREGLELFRSYAEQLGFIPKQHNPSVQRGVD